MRGILYVVVLSAVLPVCGGCLAMPNLAHPGTEEYQQTRAQIFEPYPDVDVGPPVAGGRPREYQDPRPETIRALQRPGEPILTPVPQSPFPQPPMVQPPMVQPPMAQPPMAQPPIITAPPAIYVPPTPTP